VTGRTDRAEHRRRRCGVRVRRPRVRSAEAGHRRTDAELGEEIRSGHLDRFDSEVGPPLPCSGRRVRERPPGRSHLSRPVTGTQYRDKTPVVSTVLYHRYPSNNLYTECSPVASPAPEVSRSVAESVVLRCLGGTIREKIRTGTVQTCRVCQLVGHGGRSVVYRMSLYGVR
jgi:hypothetical protein